VELMDNLKAICRDVINTHGEFQIDESKITSDADFYNDLGIDSLMAVAFMVELQRTFKIRISEEDAIKIRTLSELENYLQVRL